MGIRGRVDQLENMPGPPPNEVVLHLREGGIYRYEGTPLAFFVEASRAVYDFYQGRPLPEFGYDPNGDPAKPPIVAALENCVGYDEGGSRIAEVALATIPWSYFWQSDFERLGPEQYHKNYGWPVLPKQRQGAIH
jgi:hypothetical protein